MKYMQKHERFVNPIPFPPQLQDAITSSIKKTMKQVVRASIQPPKPLTAVVQTITSVTTEKVLTSPTSSFPNLLRSNVVYDPTSFGANELGSGIVFKGNREDLVSYLFL
jgi:hypothetical protein